MKGFTIEQLLIYDPTRQSAKKKPIEIDIQEAKIIAYFPSDTPFEQKCNTTGMAEGVYSFCEALTGLDIEGEGKAKERGWQTIFMDNCTLILSQVEQNIWIFAKLQHSLQSKYRLLDSPEENCYFDCSISEQSCKLFLQTLYQNFKLFYGLLRTWVFKQNLAQLQSMVSHFIPRFQQIYKLQCRLDVVSYFLKDIRMIPLDVNTTLKFNYFKNVLQSYNSNNCHIMIYAYGILAFTSLGKNTTHLISKYLFSNGEPYLFMEQFKNRGNMMVEQLKGRGGERFGVVYNSKIAGFSDNNQSFRVSLMPPMSQIKSPIKSEDVDLLGIEASQNTFQLFDIYVEEEQGPMKVNFYQENNMFFVTLYKSQPELSQIHFQNRFFHDNADKFMTKINSSIPSILKPNDPYKFIFHNCATYTGKSTIKEWKHAGQYIRKTYELVKKTPEGTAATSTQFGYWVYGVHRFSRILILLIPMDISLGRLDDYTNKMTKQYFNKAYM